MLFQSEKHGTLLEFIFCIYKTAFNIKNKPDIFILGYAKFAFDKTSLVFYNASMEVLSLVLEARFTENIKLIEIEDNRKAF